MNNCSVHDSVQSTAALAAHGIAYEFFPPNCTPILQPCDQNVNHFFKAEYEREWSDWMKAEGGSDENVTRYGNPAAAQPATYMAWIGRALGCIGAKVIKDSWEMSCWGKRTTAFQLPNELWALIVAFLEEDEDEETERRTRPRTRQAVRYIRKLYTGWHHYEFPVKKRRKKAGEGGQKKKVRVKKVRVVTTSTPSKRKQRATLGGSDVDTDTDVEEVKEDDSNKENEAIVIETMAEVVDDQGPSRVEKYQWMQGRENATGSGRVLNSRVTSGVWAGWQAQQMLRQVDSNRQ